MKDLEVRSRRRKNTIGQRLVEGFKREIMVLRGEWLS
jgi:hypothetical protein